MICIMIRQPHTSSCIVEVSWVSSLVTLTLIRKYLKNLSIIIVSYKVLQTHINFRRNVCY